MDKKNPTHEQIRRFLETLIERNCNNPDYILPSENQLAKHFRVSRTPIQKVLVDLQNEGIIYKVKGKGTFISRTATVRDTKVVYVVFPHIRSRFTQDIIGGLQGYLADKNVLLKIMLTDDDSVVEERVLEHVMHENCDGILFYPIIAPIYHDVLLKLRLNNYNVVVVGNYLPRLNFSSVRCDNYKQIHQLTELLVDQGHTDIAYIAEPGKDNYIYRERVQAYYDCITQKMGRSNFHVLEISPVNEDEVREAPALIRNFLRTTGPVSAMIVMSTVAEQAYNVLCEEGLANDVLLAIIDEPTDSNVLRKENVYLLDQMPYRLGWKAAEQIWAQICTGEPMREIILEDRFVEGRTWKRCLSMECEAEDKCGE